MRRTWETLRGERGRTRKLGKLLALLRPYRGRVILMFVALVLATAASLAPPYLAGRAIDDGIGAGDTGALTVILVGLRRRPPRSTGAPPTCRPTWSAGSASARCRTCAARIFSHLQSLSIGFYSRNKAGVLISRLTNDVQALDQLVTDGIVTLFSAVADAGRDRGDPAVPRPPAGAGHLRGLPGAPGRQRGLPDRLGGGVPAHPRADRHGHRLPPGDAVRHPDRARLRAGAASRAALRRAQRREPRGQHAHGEPQRRLLPVGGAAVGGRHRGDPAVRRQPGDRRRRDHRRAGLVRVLPADLLRPDPAALAAVHHLPGGHGGAGQDLPAARREAGASATPTTRSSCRACAGRSPSRT